MELLTAPDSQTLVFKLKQPDSTALSMLTATAYLYIMPRESDSGFHPKGEMRGAGPWLLDSYQPCQLVGGIP